jgi:hypothetical protein
LLTEKEWYFLGEMLRTAHRAEQEQFWEGMRDDREEESRSTITT